MEAGAETQLMSTKQQFVTVRELPARLMRVKDAAKYLAMSKGGIRALVQREELPAVIPGNNAPWLLDVKDLDHWIEKHKG